MKITGIRVREVSIPRIYQTHAADPRGLQTAEDHGRSRYQILELATDGGRVGLGEVSDIDARMRPLGADELRELLARTVIGTELDDWRAGYARVAAASANVSVPSDLVGPGLLVDDVCRQPFRYRDGALHPVDRPGLGVELDEARMEVWRI